MDETAISKIIIDLKNADLQLRNKLIEEKKLSEGYNLEMQKLHNENATILDSIIDEIGYPSADKVGLEASEAAWLIIQHAIGQPAFMKKCVNLLQECGSGSLNEQRKLAYMTDRIAAFEGKPQLYGTQFDWDESGEMSPISFDDLTNVNARRKSLGLNSMEEQTILMREYVKMEHQTPPIDFELRKREADDWRRKVGWIS